MPKADYTFALDKNNLLYAGFGRTAKYIYKSGKWLKISNPEDYEFIFDYYSLANIISYKEAMVITNNLKPKDHFTVHRRVYLTKEEIDHELTELMRARKYSKNTQEIVLQADIDTKVLVLEWLIKSPNLHELTIEMLVKNI